ncbi:MAG TPA: hypothetical protein VLK33_16580, partial [Terriglobales bacterium]|nr:hypothetical protein [Terriglobales bacterium]
RSAEGPKITAMRNPWKRVGAVHLGQIFKHYGGGGHRRVASLLLTNSPEQRLPTLMQDLLQQMRSVTAQGVPSEGRTEL